MENGKDEIVKEVVADEKPAVVEPVNNDKVKDVKVEEVEKTDAVEEQKPDEKKVEVSVKIEEATPELLEKIKSQVEVIKNMLVQLNLTFTELVPIKTKYYSNLFMVFNDNVTGLKPFFFLYYIN